MPSNQNQHWCGFAVDYQKRQLSGSTKLYRLRRQVPAPSKRIPIGLVNTADCPGVKCHKLLSFKHSSQLTFCAQAFHITCDEIPQNLYPIDCAPSDLPTKQFRKSSLMADAVL